ncbi:Intraflagellar transport protein 74 [Diplonema papillatum]|nr:Intraflagellar transport protein 74 [Diplonema papillatum]
MQQGSFGNRPPTSGAHNRPTSAAGGAGFGAPGTARRQQSPWTGAQPTAGMGVSLNTSVEVTARPVVMREGVKGMHLPSQQTGSRRTVMDRSYYLGQLRSKNSELSAELARLREEEQRLNKNAGQMNAIGGKLKALESDVQKLKGDLSDLNYAVEKSAGGVNMEKINDEAAELKEMAKHQKAQIDFKFMERQKAEEKHKLVSMQVAELTTKLETKFAEEPHKRSEYYRLREESANMASAVYMKEKDLAMLNQKYDSLHLQMKADPQKALQFQQQERLFKLEQEAQSLENEFKGDLEAEKKQLLAQVKADVNAIDTIQAGIRESKLELDEAKTKLKSLEADLQELTGDKMGKFKQLEQRDHEMQAFIDNFDSEKQKQLNQNRETEDRIVHLLEHIGETLKSGSASGRLQQMQQALQGQVQTVNESTSTHERLEKELEDRKNELKKVNNLDEKITSELEATNRRIAENEAAMNKFNDLNGLRKEHEDKRVYLAERKAVLSEQTVALKKQVQQLNTEYESTRDELQANDIHQPLQLQEQKIRQLKQNLYQLEDFIKQKTAEAAYLPIKAECMRMMEEINNYLKDPKRLERGARGKGF